MIRQELLSRVTAFFGEDGAERLQSGLVVVVGLGGVGSHMSNMLVRSGVREVRLIDFDQVSLSSLNRHACATMEDVGRSKAVVLQKFLHTVAPWCNIEAVTEMFRGSEADRLLAAGSDGKPPAYVVDCIDDVSTKAELIAYCISHGLKIIASLGAGAKADPTRLRIAPLSDCINDPLASKIKWKLKKHGVAAEDVMCVFSIEKPQCNLLPLDDDQVASPQDFGAVDYLRLRIMPVLGTSPAIFGQAMASFVLCNLAGKEYIPEACERLSKNLKHKLKEMLKRNEIDRGGGGGGGGDSVGGSEINIDDDDVEFIVQLVWQGRCCLTGKRFGGHAPLVLTRWNAHLPVCPHNLILMIQTSANLMLKPENIGEDGVPTCYPPHIVEKINTRLAWAKTLCGDEDDYLVYGSCGLRSSSASSHPPPFSSSTDAHESSFLGRPLRDSFAPVAGAMAMALILGFLVGRNNK